MLFDRCDTESCLFCYSRCNTESWLFCLIGAILRELSRRRITSADVGFKGTQLKLTLILEGGQRVLFKPKR